ncbi:MAG TPA: winged helix-turn-helix domain-containing protein [Methanothrix sp.]|nr:winged helix-turn-helix domain-containing protein [Methanothrix sp.]HPT18743.1 winged helix-turn-helix domain-containing protein [Methanothrix sp.]
MKRSRQEIIAKVLDICSDGAIKTKIVYQANLNFKTVNAYIDLLNKNGLIEVNQGPSTVYETTEKGLNLMESIKHVNSELTEF